MNRFELELTKDAHIQIRSDDNAVVQVLAMHADLDRERHLRANLYLHAFITTTLVGVMVLMGTSHDIMLVACLASLLLRSLLSELAFRDARKRLYAEMNRFLSTSDERNWQIIRRKD